VLLLTAAATCDCALKPHGKQVTVSVIILGLFTLLELCPRSPLFMPLLRALFPWALHHRHAVRVPVQVGQGLCARVGCAPCLAAAAAAAAAAAGGPAAG
jgi:hypothetical protein